MEQRPVVPYTSVSDEYAYGANPHDWHEIVVGTLKWLLIFAGLSLSAYFLYGIFIA